LFGDRTGHLILADRNFNTSDKQKHKIFRGEVKGISYLYDPASHSKQYVVVIGDDSQSFNDEKPPPSYLIKVCV
jgi:hypothetical protein